MAEYDELIEALESVGAESRRDSEIAERAIAAIQALQQQGQWQDISTAPKDGWFLGIIAGEYLPGVPFVAQTMRWSEGYQGFLDVRRWHAYEDKDVEEGWEGMNNPTHWRPLPPPPTT